MKYLFFLLFLFTNSFSFAKLVYLTSDRTIEIAIKSKISSNQGHRYKLLPGQFTSITVEDQLTIFSTNEKYCIGYSFVNNVLKDKDTLDLKFLNFHYVDTLYETWGCIESPKPAKTNRSKITYTEFNPSSIEIDSIPSVLVIKTNGRNIYLNVNIEKSASITHWDGYVKGCRKCKGCGGYSSNKTIFVQYINNQ